LQLLVGNDVGDSLGPSSADLIAGLIPFDRAALERAIDRLMDQLDDAGANQFGGGWPARMVQFSIALVSGWLAFEVMRRRLRHWSAGGGMRVRGGGAKEGPFGLPELPRSWYSRLT
jgi:hypothetical protein